MMYYTTWFKVSDFCDTTLPFFRDLGDRHCATLCEVLRSLVRFQWARGSVALKYSAAARPECHKIVLKCSAAARPECHKIQKCDIVTFGKCCQIPHFVNVWYKTTFTLYAWILLGTALTLGYTCHVSVLWMIRPTLWDKRISTGISGSL